MSFDGLPVIFNHQKERKSLGRVFMSWHDHEQSQGFSIGFAAAIENKNFLSSYASLLIMSENSVSLSTLEKDRTRTVELSITYCGARKGCMAVFCPKERGWHWCKKFGLCAKAYKWGLEGRKEKAMEKEEKLPSALLDLPNEAFGAVTETIEANHEQIESLSEELDKEKKAAKDQKEKMDETLGLLSDFLTSMIESRLSLERDSHSSLAIKKRQDFQELKKKGIFSESPAQMEHIKDMVLYCKNILCVDEPKEMEKVKRVLESFQTHFPEISSQLEEDSDNLPSTIDAAFQLLSDKVRREDKIRRIAEKQDRLKKRSTSVAERHYEAIQKDINQKEKGERKPKMSFEDFLSRNHLDDDLSPVTKKRRMNSDVPKYSSDDFMNYVRKREENRKRLDKYYGEYVKYNEKREDEKRKKVEDLLTHVPKLIQIVDKFLPKDGETRQEAPSPPLRSSPPQQLGSPKGETIDASRKENELFFDI